MGLFFDSWIYNLVPAGRLLSVIGRIVINATASIREVKATVAAMLQRSNFSLAPQAA